MVRSLACAAVLLFVGGAATEARASQPTTEPSLANIQAAVEADAGAARNAADKRLVVARKACPDAFHQTSEYEEAAIDLQEKWTLKQNAAATHNAADKGAADIVWNFAQLHVQQLENDALLRDARFRRAIEDDNAAKIDLGLTQAAGFNPGQ